MVQENITVPFRGWTVVDEIGHGSYGKVYEICRDQYGIVERAAMKVISVPQDPGEIQAYLRDGYAPETLRNMYDGSRTTVLAEYQMMVRLKDCPNIVRCDDIEIVMDPDGIGSKIYIRMELLTPIRKYDKLQGFSEKEIVKLCSDICNVLTRCEAKGIVHRDIKPGNIMVSNQGDYKLGDFGIARSMDHTTMATRIGTINYMAPEVYLGRKYGHTADIYSLGMVLYWLMNNRRIPFFPQNDREINSSSALNAQEKRMKGTLIPQPANGGPGIVRVVLKALAYDPADRYQSAMEFENEIRSGLPAERPSKRLSGSENEITDRLIINDNEKADRFPQDATVAFTEKEPLDKVNEQRRQYEEKSLRREADRRLSSSERKKAPGKEENFRTNEEVQGAGTNERAETVKIIPSSRDEDERRCASQRENEEIKEKKENDHLERKCQIEESFISVEKAIKKRKRSVIAIVAPILVACIAFVILLTIVVIPKLQYNAAVKLYNDGNYEDAIVMFRALDGYKDSSEKLDEIKQKELYDADVGSQVFFGSYEQDNDIYNGREDIEWLVLAKEENRIFVISTYALDCQPYDFTLKEVIWETCTLRKWLNGEFLKAVFSEGERAMIPSVTVSADKNPDFSTSPGNSTTDQVFLLSITEAEKYFGRNSDLECYVTTYCEAQGAEKDNDGTCDWWLRSPGSRSDEAAIVTNYGSVDCWGRDVGCKDIAVRPAMWIDLGV